MKTFILLDAYNLFHRCKHVTGGDMSIKIGMAMHIIFNSLAKIWEQYEGHHLVVCLEGKSWRRTVYPKYKLHRRVQAELRSPKEIEDDTLYNEALNEFITFLDEKTNCTVLQQQGLEADDLIASWIHEHPDDFHIIVSGDSDYYQLVSDNVMIYDGVQKKVVKINGVFDEEGKPITKKHKKSLKIQEIRNNVLVVGDTSELPETGILVYKKEKIKYDVEDGNIVVRKSKANTMSINDKLEFEIHKEQVIEPEWELFKKCIRGDSTDGIFSAYPGVRETKIRAAYEDRHEKGFVYNNLMMQTWEDKDEGEEVRVLDCFERNYLLINLRELPDEVRKLATDIIAHKTNVERVQGVGVWFLRFCAEFGLDRIKKNPNKYLAFLNAPYHD